MSTRAPDRATLVEAAPACRLALFGVPVLQSSAEAAALALPPRGHTLLVLLIAGYERPIPRSRLASMLWPDLPDDDARTNLRRHLHLIARALPADADALLLTKTTARWNPAARVGCDLLDFLQAAEDPGRHADAATIAAGELCAGIADEPLEDVRAQIAARHDTVLRALAASASASGDRTAAVLALHRLVECDPLDEPSARALVRAKFESGDRAGALREYHALVGRLLTELNVEAEPETTALFERIVTVQRASSTPHNLVAPPSSFIGRTAELVTVVDALEHHRVVTLAGPPGIGKTRLALEAAFITLDRFEGGVRFVELARETTLAAALERIAQAVEAVPADDPLDGVLAKLARSRVLLVLDNLEQMGDDARLLIDALTRGSAVRILATSRRTVRAEGERVVALGALGVPPSAPTPPEALARYGAVRLFLERATKVAPSVRLTFANARSVSNIVRRLDGIPLAIELVASRANLLTVDGMSKRLDEGSAFANPRRGERHVTIDAAIAWSYELLTASERAVFRRIAVFGDSCTAESLEDLCASIEGDVVSAVSELVESSLLLTEPSDDTVRYRTFEMTRTFALERLRAHGEYDDAARRHAHHYVALAESWYGDFTTDAEQAAYLRCDAEQGNFTVAMTWSLENDPVSAARLLAALWRYWIFRGRARAGEAVVERLERDGVFGRLTALELARVLQAAGMLARETRLASARQYLDRALATFRACGDERGELETLTAIAAFLFTRNIYDEAEEQFRICLTLQSARGDRRAAAGTLANLAQLAWRRGNCDEALEKLDLALEGFRATKNARGIAFAMRTRSLIYGTMGRHDEAIAYAQQSVVLYETLGETARVAEALAGLSDQCADAGRLGEAFAAVCRSLDLLAAVGNEAFLCNALRGLHFMAYRASEFEDVLRVDTFLRSVARRIGQPAGRPDGSTDDALAAARAALPAFLAAAAVESAATMELQDIAQIAQRLARRHADLIVEPVLPTPVGR
ncbi:MAG: hypothetical protein NVS3B7_02040 [Candidatus Elarobacter sp.]